MSARLYVRPGSRAHSMRFNIDAQGRRRLKVALQTLDGHEQSVREALTVNGLVPSALGAVRLALQTLIYGENGELR